MKTPSNYAVSFPAKDDVSPRRKEVELTVKSDMEAKLPELFNLICDALGLGDKEVSESFAEKIREIASFFDADAFEDIINALSHEQLVIATNCSRSDLAEAIRSANSRPVMVIPRESRRGPREAPREIVIIDLNAPRPLAV